MSFMYINVYIVNSGFVERGKASGVTSIAERGERGNLCSH